MTPRDAQPGADEIGAGPSPDLRRDWRRTRQVVLERDGHLCRRCWRHITDQPHSIHHRKMRSQGGGNDLPNLVTLCGTGTTGCHGWVHAHPRDAYLHGWLVESWRDPTDAPIIYRPPDTFPDAHPLTPTYVYFLTLNGWEPA